MEDLARAVAFIHENKNQLKIDVTSYSVWGGSAGGRMAAWLGDYGTESLEKKLILDQVQLLCNIRVYLK